MNHASIHPAALPVEELLRDCEVRHEKRGGPGGQHRNKTETAVVLKHRPTGVEGQAAERRSQADNHRNATKRLRINLALEVRCESPENAGPSALWRSRCHEGRIAVNPDHDDFASLLAEALDVISLHHFQVPGSARQLEVTASQLLKLLKKEPRAFLLLNNERRKRHLPTLE